MTTERAHVNGQTLEYWADWLDGINHIEGSYATANGADCIRHLQAALAAAEQRATTAEQVLNVAETNLAMANSRIRYLMVRADSDQDRQRPKIICLCGSTKFIDHFAIQTWELELTGAIVLGCTLLPSWYCPVRDHFAELQGVKEQRDEHHLRKIDLADEVLVLNIGGYIGESTRNEIAYATKTGKPVRYLEEIPVSSPRPTGEET